MSLLLVLLVFAVSARAVLATPNNQQVLLGAFIPGNKDKVPLQAVIKTNKNKYVVGEPVFVTAMVQNIANKPLKVLSDLLQWQMDILIAKEGGKFQRFRRGQADLVYKAVEPAAVELKPGENLRFRVQASIQSRYEHAFMENTRIVSSRIRSRLQF